MVLWTHSVRPVLASEVILGNKETGKRLFLCKNSSFLKRLCSIVSLCVIFAVYLRAKSFKILKDASPDQIETLQRAANKGQHVAQ